MASPCDKIEVFVDGELPPDEAEAFRHHLVDCARCQRELASLMQLRLLGQRYADKAATQPWAPEPSSRRFLPTRWRYPLLGAVAALAVALAVLVVRSSSTPSLQHDTLSLQHDVWLAESTGRLLEARVSYPGADIHRPMAAKMMGGAGASAELPLEDLAVLEKQDPHGLVAAYLVHNNPALADQALLKLKGLGSSPDLDSDRAVAMLLKGQPEEALRLLDAALAKNPNHPQALWNQGLILSKLGLPLLAAKSFSRVADLHEPGWAKEAEEKAKALQGPEDERHQRYMESSLMIKKFISGEQTALPEGFSQLPSARRLFYEAVRTAPDRNRVMALLSTAQELDAQAGGKVLEDYVRRVAKADFQRRAPLAASYAALLKEPLSNEARDHFIEELSKSHEDDILLGALFATRQIAQHLKLYEAKAAASGDPWFQLLAAEERAMADAADGNWKHAIQVLNEVEHLCDGQGLEYRCIARELTLSNIYIHIQQFDLALQHTQKPWQKARSLDEWPLESRLLWNLATIVRARGDTAQAHTYFLARAYLLEFLEHDKDDAGNLGRAHEELAVMAMQELKVEEARREIDAELKIGNQLGMPGIFALAEIARLKREPEDEARLTQAVEKLAPSLSPGDRLVATHVLGRFFIEIEKDAEKGRELLRKVIHEAEAPEFAGDNGALRARTYSFTSLILDAGRRKEFQKALTWMEQERGLKLPGVCLLAATADSGRTLLLGRGDDGALTGRYDEARREPLPPQLDGLVPEELQAKLAKCKPTQVLARPPLNGRAGLLPSKLAWSYLTRTSDSPPSPTGPAVHLVVSNVELPPGVSLEPLNPWRPSFGPHERHVELSGAEATPSRVLEAMKDATEIDLAVHGILTDSFNDSYLLLAPEPGGPELSMSKVRSVSLRRAPFVVLVACNAAHTSYSLFEPLSLPAAFIQAGARGVLAATTEIPDLDAQAFFDAVRERMRAGVAPALALHEVRVQWLKQGKGEQWLDSVLLFE